MYSKELTEKKNDLITRAEEVLGKAKMEKRELTEAEAEELAEIRDNVRRIVKSLDIADDFDSMDEKQVKVEEGEPKEMTEEEKIKEVEIQETRAFENYIRGQIINERSDVNLTKGDNGAIIPTTIANRIIKKVYDISPILERSQKFNVKGNLDLPYYDVETTAITVAYQTEFVDLESSVGEIKSITLGGFLGGALVKVSRSLIDNSQFDVVAFVVDEMAYQIARFIEGELLNGTQNKVTGLSTLTNTVNAASSTAVTGDELIELQSQIKDIYQNNAIWIMSPKTRTALRQLKSDTGFYLLNEDITAPFGYTLLGKPVYVSDNMPDMEAGKNAIYYGDMTGLATKFSEEINIQVLRERFAIQHADAVVGWFEFDSKIQDAQKIAALTMKTASV